ncbi:hypothetical protein ACTA71_006462 [Dictyostelium dimigraforme]
MGEDNNSFLYLYFFDRMASKNGKFVIKFFTNHILMEKINYRSMIVNAPKREIIYENGFSLLFSNFKQISFPEFNFVIPDHLIRKLLQIEPYSFLLHSLKNIFYIFPNLSKNMSITPVYDRLVEIDKVMDKMIKKHYYTPIDIFHIKVIGDDNIGILCFCNQFNNLSISKNYDVFLIDNKLPILTNAYILAYNVGIKESFKNIENYFNNYIITKKPFLLVGLDSNLNKQQRKITYNDGKELANKLNIELFFEIPFNGNFDFERLLRCCIYERSADICNITLSNFLQELNYSTILKSSAQLSNSTIKHEKPIYYAILELIMFCVDLPIIQFIDEIKSLGIKENIILNLLKKDIIEMKCIVYKLQSIKLNRYHHQHHLSLDKSKQFSYRNFQKLFIYSKIENYKEITNVLSPIYSHGLVTTNFIKSYFNDKTMYSKKDIENLNQDISWCDDIILRVNLIGNFELIKYYQERMVNTVNYSNNCTIINFKNKSVSLN